jgi:hypothetical protein
MKEDFKMSHDIYRLKDYIVFGDVTEYDLIHNFPMLTFTEASDYGKVTPMRQTKRHYIVTDKKGNRADVYRWIDKDYNSKFTIY